jgi:hypothetical protein
VAPAESDKEVLMPEFLTTFRVAAISTAFGTALLLAPQAYAMDRGPGDGALAAGSGWHGGTAGWHAHDWHSGIHAAWRRGWHGVAWRRHGHWANGVWVGPGWRWYGYYRYARFGGSCDPESISFDPASCSGFVY